MTQADRPISPGPPPPGVAGVGALVARARDAQRAWAEVPVASRARRLAPLADRMLDRAAEIAAVVHGEVGKPEVEVLLGEVLPSADLVSYWTRTIEPLLLPAEVPLDQLSFPRKAGTIFREPRG